MTKSLGAQRNKRHLLVGTCVSLILIYFIAKEVDFEALKEAFARAKLLWIAPFLCFAGLSLWYKTDKWRLLMKPLKEASIKVVMPSVVIGTAVNFLLFSYVGELIRVYLYHRESKIPKSALFGSIILERIFDVIFVVIFGGIGFLSSKSLPGEWIALGYAILLFGFISFVFVAGAVFFTESYLKGFRSLLKILPLHLQESFINHLEQGISGCHSLRSPKLLLCVMLAGFAQWVFIGIGVYSLLIAVDAEVPFYVSFITVAAIVFGSILPSSPAQIGMIEFSFILSLGLFGVPKEKALAAALLYHFFLYLAMCLLAFWYLKRMGMQYESVLTKAEQLNETE